MIVNRIEQITKEIEELQKKKELSNQTTKFVQRNDELSFIFNELEKVLDIIMLFREIGFNIDYIYGFTNIRLLSSIRSLNSLVKSNTDKAGVSSI